MYSQTMIVFDILVLYRYYDTTSAVDSKKIVKRDRHAMYTSVHFQTSKNRYRLKSVNTKGNENKNTLWPKNVNIVNVQVRRLLLIKSCFVSFCHFVSVRAAVSLN